MRQTVTKILTKNDLGLTGSHQAGICVPFKIANLGFFPSLDETAYNPRATIEFRSKNGIVKLEYIHYNSKVLGKGTRNEYRLTGVSRFFRDNNCKVGDTLEFMLNDGVYSIDIRKETTEDDYYEGLARPLVIRADWQVKRG